MEDLNQPNEAHPFKARLAALGRTVLKIVETVGPHMAPPEFLLYTKQAEREVALDQQVCDEAAVLGDSEALARQIEEWRRNI